jgi:malate dehydrogenase (oxaloacetate-decarboxylating)(NADP+)
VDATTINEPMKVAAVEAIADLARAEGSEVSRQAYGGADRRLRPGYTSFPSRSIRG